MVPSFLEPLVTSFSLICVSEMGDKTQLLAFSLAARFKKPWPVLGGIIVASIFGMSLSAVVGAEVATLISPKVMAWILAAIFIACGGWALIPDKDDEKERTSSHGAFATTMVLFFLAEMGDKTQVATVALAARYKDIFMVSLGSVAGLILTNMIGVFLGHNLAERINMNLVRRAASALFFAFGFYSIYNAFTIF